DRRQGNLRGGACPPGGRGQGDADFHDADAGDVQHAAFGHHQGGGAVGQLHFGGVVPGDDQGADRGGAGRQGRLPGRPEGERHPRPSGSGRHRFPHASGGGSASQRPSAAGRRRGGSRRGGGERTGNGRRYRVIRGLRRGQRSEVRKEPADL